MKKIALIALLNSGLFFSYFNANSQNNTILKSEEESKTIVESPAYQNLKNYQIAFLDKIQETLNRGVSISSIKDAALASVRNPNNYSFYSLIFVTVAQGQQFINNFYTAKRDFLNQNAFIQMNESVFTCLTCQPSIDETVNNFFENFNGYYKYKDERSTAAKVTCGSWWNQVKLVGCTALCSASTAGLAAALCGWGCWCTFCTKNSVVANTICAD